MAEPIPPPEDNKSESRRVRVYDRPDQPVRSAINPSLVLLIAVILAILAYFAYQWLI